MRTQVGIVGAGPAGLMLGHLLHLAGIDSVIVEDRARDYVIERVRAGVLEQGTVDLLVDSGVGARLQREGLFHDGIYINVFGKRRRIDMAGLTGRRITVYGQNEVVKDLIAARVATGRPLLFEVADVSVHDLDSTQPTIRFSKDGEPCEIRCDFIAGCDGFHGICRPSIPAGQIHIYERVYPFGWLGILASAAPSSPELVYSLHERGFALFSMRSNTVTRLYLQCSPSEDMSQWPDDRIWEELLTRLGSDDGWKPAMGPITQKGVTGMRSFVTEPMQFGRMFLAGDAAHIVPPTGAKGLNLAMADVWRLSRAVGDYYQSGGRELLDRYSEDCLKRVWRAQQFSWWMTSLLHKSDTENHFDHRRQRAELEYVTSSPAAMTSLAENYVGFPIACEPTGELPDVFVKR
ncbi:MAG TPA: 4-hydroxybenzoate 3-monooxygenase [Terriglobia bacterium]|nr:4-hydroxybenzoate 3-monooxygenase [Terriglobia bacterium]